MYYPVSHDPFNVRMPAEMNALRSHEGDPIRHMNRRENEEVYHLRRIRSNAEDQEEHRRL
jgi:hypothetical protein